MLVVFYQTLRNDQPKWTLDSSRIGSSPGIINFPSVINYFYLIFFYVEKLNETGYKNFKTVYQNISPCVSRPIGIFSF